MRTSNSGKRTAIALALTLAAGIHLPAWGGVPSTWTSRGVGGGGALFAPRFDPHDGNTMFVACDMSELFRTTNSGTRWAPVDFRELQGNRACEVQFSSNPAVLFALDCTSVDGGDTRRPSRSLDGGKTWTLLPSDPTSMEAYSLFADIESTNRILVSDYSNIYLSTNAGLSFASKFSFGGGGNGCFISGTYFEGSNIYVGTTAGLLISSNGGSSFAISPVGGIPTTEEMVSLTGARQSSTTRLFCVTVDKDTLYAGIPIEDAYGANRSVYTLDIGQTNWIVRTNGITAGHRPLFVSMTRNDIQTAYIAGQRADDYPAVYKTVNGGTSWQNVMLPTTNLNVQTGWCGWLGDRDYTYDAYYVGFSVSQLDANRAVISGYGFVHVTTNGGVSWNAGYVNPADLNPAGVSTPKGKAYHSVGLENTTCWWLTWVDSNNLFASFSDIRGIRSVDAGKTWSFNYSGQNYNSTYEVLKGSSGTLYAAVGTVHDMYQSTRLADSPLDSGTGEVLFSTSSGAVWQRLHNFTNVVFNLALDPNYSNRLYAAVVHSTRGGFYVSSNIQNGAASTWTKLSNPPRTEGHPFMLQNLNDGTLVCTYSGRRNGGGTFTASSGVFVSTNAGASWTDRSHTNMFYWTKDIVLDPYDPGQSNWYVGVFSGWGGAPNGKGGLYRTTNRGQTWTRIMNSDRVTSCTFSPVNSNELFFTTEVEGLWHTDSIRSTNPVFTQVASYPFRQPERVFFNPYNANEVWVTSFGHGLRSGKVTPVQPLVEDVASSSDDEVVIQWFGEDDQTYAVERSTNLFAGFSVVVSNLPGLPSIIYTDDVSGAGAVFYRLQTE